MNLLEVDGLGSGYQSIPILRDVSFYVVEGEFLGILGHNGMGKSTLLKTISGEIKATSGTISLGGTDVTAMPAHKRARSGIGFVPQGRRIFPGLTVRENLEVAALAAGKSPAVVDEVLKSFPRLMPILDRAGAVLSGGEQQILALARCLCGGPRLILLDEPTEGIQPSIRAEIIDLLKELGQKHAFAMVLVEQNEQFLSSLCERTYVCEKGRLKEPEFVADGIG
ncbi:ABC transporter ATP-binding protein [Methyloligella solikamskensis]|uniref:ABC transporter ATP-binding protein n=1 Tax=Methyloligella solikamskensis TaxID=1177756 RepID=A0ABW3J7E3_9HYPH